MRSAFLTETESTPNHLRALSAELAAAVLLSCVLLQVAVFCFLLVLFSTQVCLLHLAQTTLGNCHGVESECHSSAKNLNKSIE